MRCLLDWSKLGMLHYLSKRRGSFQVVTSNKRRNWITGSSFSHLYEYELFHEWNSGYRGHDMSMVIASSIALLLGIALVAVRLFQEGHFYGAALLIASVGALGLFAAMGIYLKNQNIVIREEKEEWK